jgi:hypothetical protein
MWVVKLKHEFEVCFRHKVVKKQWSLVRVRPIFNASIYINSFELIHRIRIKNEGLLSVANHETVCRVF